MRIAIITLFPEVFTYLDVSIIGRAKEKGLLAVDFVNPRDFTDDKHRTVDDVPYGGGSGMVLKCDPFFRAVRHVRENLGIPGKVIMATPQGKRFDQDAAVSLSREESLVFLCGHYEGFDERIRTIADQEISLGDFVLTGGEIPVMAIVDAACRLIPGVIDEGSAREESFYDHLLDYPQWTRPPIYEGMEAPPVLLSGHHEKVRIWRRKESIKRTLQRRPDLLERMELNSEDQELMKEILGELQV
jgi:tRNA (guanine37-N1)-methyltransferase